eukprot:38338-Eustigmatos_ZCMA.PRE.1
MLSFIPTQTRASASARGIVHRRSSHPQGINISDRVLGPLAADVRLNTSQDVPDRRDVFPCM